MKLLIVDDDLRQRELLADVFAGKGYTVRAAASGEEALLCIGTEDFDTVVTDLKMGRVDGTEVLRACHARDQELPVIVITGYGSVDSAIAAMKIGAHDYIEKPFDPEELAFTVDRAIEHYRLVRKNRELLAALNSLSGEELIGSSKEMAAVRALIARVAPLDVTVLIEGETGTGKELVARQIHRHSKRSAGRFLAVNCGAINEALLESELFGHEKGAFTGAIKQKQGLFEAADGGTLFLDEINSMPPALQVRLLRVLQDGRFLRVGGTSEVESDFRLIGAANADLAGEVERGRFRSDLYYRLYMMSIPLPPLRERAGDIAELAHHFLNVYNRRYNKQIKGIDAEAMELLCRAAWPGNVRELQNAIGRAVIMESSPILTAAFLPVGQGTGESPQPDERPDNWEDSLNLVEMEKRLIRLALGKTGGRRGQAAKLLGIDVSTLWRKMQRYGLQSS